MQHMQSIVMMMPAAKPEKNPTSTPGVENWLQCDFATAPLFVDVSEAEALDCVGDEPEDVVFASDDDAESDGLALDEGAEELDEDDSSLHSLSLTQLMPAGQHESPHFGRGVVKSVVKSWLSGCDVAFCC